MPLLKIKNQNFILLVLSRKSDFESREPDAQCQWGPAYNQEELFQQPHSTIQGKGLQFLVWGKFDLSEEESWKQVTQQVIIGFTKIYFTKKYLQ